MIKTVIIAKMKKFFVLFLLFSVQLFSDSESIRKILSANTDWDLSSAKIEKLTGGLTNDNYTLQLGSKKFVVRYATENTIFLGYSQDKEWQINKLAASIGLSPKAILFIPSERIMINEFIETNGKVVDLHKRSGMQSYSKCLRLLHRQKITSTRFKDFCPFESIDEYARKLIEVCVSLPKELESALQKIKRFKIKERKKVLCHLDLHHENMLFAKHKVFVIDWEHAAMADPYFDLACTASVELYTDKEMYDLLHWYLKRKPKKTEKNHLYQMRILADIRWALWSYLQSKISPIDGPYLTQAEEFMKNGCSRL